MSQNGAQLKLKNGTENGKSAPIRATKIDEIAMLNWLHFTSVLWLHALFIRIWNKRRVRQ